ncbi:zinc finger protein 62 homolog [Dermacentor silvarum]|nr:zinc finger protein 62 homolog [Dermacentor silvarum]XP_049525309.1 zinc finger protein 62 homolog [Dermacentor silvarum]XP_049525310.1 zinc finger protein 62 homolog [Dermacentor silvarum]
MPDGNMDVGSSKNHNSSSNASDGGDAPKHVCGLCWTSFSSPTELQQHCLECFSEDYSVSRESEEEGSPSPEKARDCEAPSTMEVTEDAAEGESPIREDSPSTSSLPDGKTLHLCKLCPKTFTNYGSYRRHLRMHSCGHRYTCDICGKQFFRRYLWIKHYEKIHNSMMQNMCQCTVCEMWLKNSDTLKEHIRTKHRFASSVTGDVDLAGDTAGKPPVETIVLDSLSLQPIKESTDSSLADNGDAGSAKTLNGTKHQWMCNLCSEVFGTKAQLMKHKEDRHGRKRVWAPKAPTPEADDTKRIKIEEVAKEVFHGMLSEFSLQGMLSSEAQKVKKETKAAELATGSPFSPAFPGTGLCDPTKRGVFLCEVCKKTFINRSSYLRHKKMHTGVRPYTCEHCCMSFFRSESLTTHKKKHLSGDQFKCFVCGHIAEGASDLSSHFLSSHSKLPEEYDKNTIVRSRRGRPSKYTMLPELMGQTPPQQTAEEAVLCAKKLDQGNQDCDANSEDTVLVGLNGDADSLNSAADKYTCLVCFQFFPDEQSYYDHQCKDDVSAISKTLEQGKDSSSQDEKEDGGGLTGMPHTFLALEVCTLCSAKFPTKKHLQEHMIIHICRYCGRCFKETGMLSKHVESVHKELVQSQSHTCCCCDLTLEDGNALVEHVLDKHSTMLPSFDISAQSKSGMSNIEKKSLEEFVTPAKVGIDSNACELDKGRYHCGWCQEHFLDLQQMIIHFREIHSIINIVGDSGSGVYSSDVEKNLHGTVTKQCLKCCEPLADSMHICSDKSICNLCLRTFDDPHNAHVHQELNHLLVDWYCCDACDACGPRDVMEKHVLSHMSKVGNLVVPETPSKSLVPLMGNSEPFQNVREAFLNWCRNGTTKGVEVKHNSALPNGESVNLTADRRVKTRSEILIEEAKRGFPPHRPIGHAVRKKEDASLNGEGKQKLSKDIIELLPKNGEITMIPIKSETPEPYSQLRSALTTAKRRSSPSTFDRNGNILKTLLGERRSPLTCSDYPWEKSADAAICKNSASETDDQAASDPGWYEREPKGSPASDQGTAGGGSSSNVVLKCDDCKRLFTHYSSWKRHRRQHLGLSTHTCGECERIFYRKDQYDKHVQSHQHKNGAEV